VASPLQRPRPGCRGAGRSQAGHSRPIPKRVPRPPPLSRLPSRVASLRAGTADSAGSAVTEYRPLSEIVPHEDRAGADDRNGRSVPTTVCGDPNRFDPPRRFPRYHVRTCGCLSLPPARHPSTALRAGTRGHRPSGRAPSPR
jgi:hypothetical protein